MARELGNLREFDWDDSELIKAYERGVKLSSIGYKTKNSKGKKRDSRKEKEWEEGDFCQALYPDGVLYEAKIVSIDDDTCIVDFLGYDEELEVDVDTLIESGGKKARRKQIRKAGKSLNHSNHLDNIDESGDDTRDNKRSLMGSKIKHRSSHGNQMLNHTITDYNTTAAAESTFHTTFQAAAQCNSVPPPSMLAPGFPPMPACPNISQDSSLAAMMASWYMAGYYTGLHQVQKNQRCCCHAPQNCCRH